MAHALIRTDDHGTYVRAGGYIFRPPETSHHVAESKINAYHRSGTTTASVGGELWDSYSGDPQYIAYVYPDGMSVDTASYLTPLPARFSPELASAATDAQKLAAITKILSAPLPVVGNWEGINRGRIALTLEVIAGRIDPSVLRFRQQPPTTEQIASALGRFLDVYA